MDYAFHDATSVLPPLSGSEIDEMAQTLASGESLPLASYEGLLIESPGILDAYSKAGVEPQPSNVDLNGQGPIEFAITHALSRRSGLTAGQRAVMALWLLPQYDDPDRSGRPGRGTLAIGYPVSGEAIDRAAKLTGAGISAVQTALRIQKLKPELLDYMFSGEFSISRAARELGLARGFHSRSIGHIEHTTIDAKGRGIPTYFGKGDKWKEAITPINRYLKSWEKRGFEYRHLNPKEARKRLQAIDELQEQLERVKADLEPRAHSATMTIGQKGK